MCVLFFKFRGNRYIRKVFNTNPILTDSTITDTANLEKYFLAHTFDRAVRDTVSGSAAGSCYGFLLGLGDSGDDEFQSVEFSDFKFGEDVTPHLGGGC